MRQWREVLRNGDEVVCAVWEEDRLWWWLLQRIGDEQYRGGACDSEGDAVAVAKSGVAAMQKGGSAWRQWLRSVGHEAEADRLAEEWEALRHDTH